MRRKTLTLVLASLAVMALCGTLYSQEDIKALSDPAFQAMRRSPVPFNHDRHNEKAKIADCKTCHHLYKNGKLDPAGDSAGTKCSECHAAKGGNGAMPLERAYHRQCGNCHAQKGAGPVACGECHPKGGVRK